MPKKKLGPYQKAAKLSNDHFIETGVRIPANTIYARLRSGWSTTEAVLPVGESRPSKKYGAAKKKRAAAKRRASVTHTTTKTTRVEYSSEPDKKKRESNKDEAWQNTIVVDHVDDSAVPNYTVAGTTKRRLDGDGPIVDPAKDTGWIWLVLIIGALALGSYGLLKGIAGV